MFQIVRDLRGRFASEPDPFDPRYWREEKQTGVKAICLSNRFDVHCVLDREDYVWAGELVWTLTRSSTSPDKNYAKRNKVVDGAKLTLFLHREIMGLKEPLPHEYSRILKVDHIDGDSLNNRRDNLRWATNKMNATNINGRDYMQPDLVGYDMHQVCERELSSDFKSHKMKLVTLPNPQNGLGRQLNFKF